MNVRRHEVGFEETIGTWLLTPVLKDTWKTSQSDLLSTVDVDSSFAVAIHHSQAQIGYLGHFFVKDLSLKTESSYRNMLEGAMLIGDSAHLSGWIGGLSKMPLPRLGDKKIRQIRRYNRDIKDNRHKAVELLGSLGINRPKINWIEDHSKIAVATFDTASGDVNYVVEPLDYHHESSS